MHIAGGRSREPQDTHRPWERELEYGHMAPHRLLPTSFLLGGGHGEGKDPKFRNKKTLTIAPRNEQTSSLGGGEGQGWPAGKYQSRPLTERASGSKGIAALGAKAALLTPGPHS